MNLTKLNKDGRVEGFCLVRSVQKKISSRKTTYLDLILSDSDGEMVAKLLNEQIPTKTGIFGADMKVNIVNDGPVTILIDSKNRE